MLMMGCRCYDTDLTEDFDSKKFHQLEQGLDGASVISILGEPFEKIAHLEFEGGKTNGIAVSDISRLEDDFEVLGYSWFYSRPGSKKCDYVQWVVRFNQKYMVLDTYTVKTD
jgi:hypothetical protein